MRSSPFSGAVSAISCASQPAAPACCRRGALHPGLVARLADEAANTASDMLTICIRALDYCPPVDITFGDYLRALITADIDLFAEDRYDYRVALHGIISQRAKSIRKTYAAFQSIA